MSISENGPRARRAYAREEEGANDLPTDFLHQFSLAWSECAEEMEALQNQKKAMLATVRNRYGRHQAEAVKIAMRCMLLDPTKRKEQAAFDDIARLYVDLLESEIEARQYEH